MANDMCVVELLPNIFLTLLLLQTRKDVEEVVDMWLKMEGHGNAGGSESSFAFR